MGVEAWPARPFRTRSRLDRPVAAGPVGAEALDYEVDEARALVDDQRDGGSASADGPRQPLGPELADGEGLPRRRL